MIFAWARDARNIARSSAPGIIDEEIFAFHLGNNAIQHTLYFLFVVNAHEDAIRIFALSDKTGDWKRVGRSKKTLVPSGAVPCRFETGILNFCASIGTMQGDARNIVGVSNWVKVVLWSDYDRLCGEVRRARLEQEISGSRIYFAGSAGLSI